MFARLYNVAWSRTGRDRPVLPMATIKTRLDAAGAATSAARTDFRYIKRGVLQLPGVASDQDYRANYLIYSNDDVHYFGAWIDSIEWASAGSFAVTFTDDLFTTFAAGATVQGYVTRKKYENIPAGYAGDGDFAVNGWANIWTWELSFSTPPVLLVYLTPGETDLIYAFSKTPSAAFIAVVQNDTDFTALQAMLADPLFKFESIVAAYLVPASLVLDSMLTTAQYKYNLISTPFTFKTFRNAESTQSPYTFNVSLDPAIETRYKIFLNNHDSTVRIRLGGNSTKINVRDLYNTNFEIRAGFSPTPFITITPTYKAAPYTGGSAGNTPTFGFNKFPQAPLSADAFASWIQSVAFPAVMGLAAGALTGGIGGIGMLVGGVAGLAMNGVTSHMIPDYSAGDSNAVFSSGRGAVGIDILIPANSEQGFDYYDQFGFPCGQRESFTIQQSTLYAFIQSTDNVITGNMPAAAKDEIDAALKAGVRCWNTIGLGDYT